MDAQPAASVQSPPVRPAPGVAGAPAICVASSTMAAAVGRRRGATTRVDTLPIEHELWRFYCLHT